MQRQGLSNLFQTVGVPIASAASDAEHRYGRIDDCYPRNPSLS
jgi:hypothetical protein